MDGNALKPVAQRSCDCPIPGSFQGQVGWVFKQPDLVGVSLSVAGRLGLDNL